MADFWDQLLATSEADVTSEFQKDAGRAPTADELSFYEAQPNAAAQIQANSTAANGYATVAAGGVPTPTRDFSPIANRILDAGGGNTFGAPPDKFNAGPDLGAPQTVGPYVAPQWSGTAPTFTAPTGVNYLNDPGADYRIKRVGQAVQQAAAARGSVLNPGTVLAIGDATGQQASAEFGNVYARAGDTFDKALQSYQTNYGTFLGNAGLTAQSAGINAGAAGQNNAANLSTATFNAGKNQAAYTTNFNANETSQTDYWNRLAQLAGAGQSAATSTVTA